MRAFLSVSDRRNLEKFLKWLEDNGFEVDMDEEIKGNYDVVVVNLPSDLPRSESRLLKEGKFKEAGLLAHASIHYEDILPVCDPDDYDVVMELFEKAGDVPKSVRRVMAVKALLHSLEYLSRVHTRMSELFGITDYVHHAWKVKMRILEKSYVEEYLTDIPESVFFGKGNPLVPFYAFVLDLIPKGSRIFFNRAIPIHATLHDEDHKAEVMVYNGVSQGGNYELVVARGGSADVIVKERESTSLTVESEGVGYRLEVEEAYLGNEERLASVFVSVSPAYTAVVFEGGRSVDVEYSEKEDIDINKLRSGDILAVNFKLSGVDCTKYKKIIAPDADEKVKRRCGRKLLLRRF